MNLSISDVLGYINQGLDLIKKLAPIASALGIPGVSPAVTAAGALADIAENALARVQDGQLAATTTDKATLEALIVKLRALNDAEDAEAAAS